MTHRGCVPSAPFARVIQEWLVDKEEGLKTFAALMKMDASNACKLAYGKRPLIGFDIADRIICVIDPLLRIHDPEISAIYQEFDLEWLDRTRPCAA